MDEEYNFYQLCTPFYFLCFLIGYSPFRLRKTGITTNHFYDILTVILIAGFIVSFVDGIYDRFNNYKPNGYIEKTIDCLQLFGNAIAQIVTWIECLIMKKKLITIYDKLNDFDKIMMKKLNIDFQYKKEYYSWVAYIVAGMIFYNLIGNSVVYIYQQNIQEGIPVGFWLIYEVPFLMGGVRVFQVIQLVEIIKTRFNHINKELINIAESVTISNPILNYEKTKTDILTITDFDVISSKNKVEIGLSEPNINLTQVFNKKNSLKKIDVDKNAPFTHNFKEVTSNYMNRNKIQTSNVLISRLGVLCDFHDELCDIFRIIDEVFGFSILIIMAMAFVSITSQLYYVFTIISGGDSATLVANITWVIPIIFQTVFLCAMCHLVVTEANATGPLLHKIQAETTDARFTDFIELFSLQLMHQTVKFSPCGFFDVDFTLLYAMIGAITTYLVILIQFHLSTGESPDNSTTTTTAIMASTMATTII